MLWPNSCGEVAQKPRKTVQMSRASWLQTIAALMPLPFLALGPILNGGFALVALIYLTVFAFLIDEAVRQTPRPVSSGRNLPSALADIVPVILALAHFALLPLAVILIAGTEHQPLIEKLINFAAFSLFFGTVSVANAHELIHRSDLLKTSLGKWVFISLLFGHHVSAHLSVHHSLVATPLDPNTARLNESFYRFFNRAWRGSFRAGLAVETARLGQSGRGMFSLRNPYLAYCGGALVFLALAVVLAGWQGAIIYLGFAVIAQVQLLLSDYVQHYGLERQIVAQNKFEPVSVRHSWNAPHLFSSALMLHAPRHSDHHANPSVPYEALQLFDANGAPMLPRSVPAMSCLALWPRKWKQVMNPRVARWVDCQTAAGAN